MTEKDCRTIELDKILQQAQEHALCKETKEEILALRPNTDTEHVRQMLKETDAMVSMLQQVSNPRYSAVNDAQSIVHRADKGGTLSMGELLQVASVFRNFRYLRNWYDGGIYHKNILEGLFYTLSPNQHLEVSIYDAILSDTEMADNASDELYDIRKKIRNTESGIRDKLESIIKSQSFQKYLQDNVVTLRHGRFVVPVKAEYRGEVNGVIHDVSASGSTLFVEPAAVVEANAKIMQLRSSEVIEIDHILRNFSEQIAQEAALFSASYQAMLKIDLLIAKAKLAIQQSAFCPTVESGNRFQLKKARHPLISKDIVVPVDVSLGYEYDTLIITGPNTGGKTVTLKTAGLLCAMACCGLLIPAAENSSVCVFHQILVDIGDEQSIEQSLSTFSGHMKNITAILEKADENALVLVDELGAGTDPAEGAALALSIIEQLRAQGAKILATTHYAELKLYALDTQGVQNASCEFDIETLQPTYKLIVGVPGRSNAFLIGEKLGIPRNVIEQAKTNLSSENRHFEEVLVQLDRLKAELRESEEEVEQLKDAAGFALEKAAKERDALIRQGETELNEMREKAKRTAQEVQNEAYRLYDEMKALQKKENMSAQQKAQRARQIARGESEKLYHTASEGQQGKGNYFPPLQSVKIGEQVVLSNFGTAATVTALPDANGNVEVLAGIVKTKVPLSDLHAPLKTQPTKNKRTHIQGNKQQVKSAPRTAATEINLIGMNVDEAIMEADAFIDNAVMNGQHMLYLIHGKGTGTLRSGIHQHLKKHKNIASFRLGKYGEGEDGVTIVELK